MYSYDYDWEKENRRFWAEVDRVDKQYKVRALRHETTAWYSTAQINSKRKGKRRK
jgi:hypothetical protein